MIKIDPNKPLPRHTKLKWEECFAKLILESFLPKEFKKLSLKDKPDLQNEDHNLGIEVTMAVDKIDSELDRLYIGIEYNQVRNKEQAMKKIEKLGGKINRGILIHPGKSRSFSNVKRMLEKKLELLNNKNIKYFKHNYLFVIDELLIHDYELLPLLTEFMNIQDKYKKKFERIYLYILWGELYEFDLKKQIYKIINVDREQIWKIGNEAREMVALEEEKD